jgi:spore coat polysaccharide biosynthesis protein SpsF
VATTTEENCQPIADLCDKKWIRYFRGSEDDVLSRYYETAKRACADIVVRVTSDCPLIDPAIVAGMIDLFLKEGSLDFLSNSEDYHRSYPIGMDCEIMSFKALEEANRDATKTEDRGHVCPFLYTNRDRFRVKFISYSENLSHYRWTLDTPEDYELLTKILEDIYPDNPRFTMNDLVVWAVRHPDLQKINEHVQHNHYTG